MTLAAGTRLGAFVITDRIGAGGMGEVYRATDSRLGRQVAIKTVPAALAGDKDRLARFEREAKLLAALNHAHIASVYSLDEHDGVAYIAMELVEGETLEETLKRGPLSIKESLQIAVQVAQALEAAHERGVVHRDLKPANIMITRDGVVKVLDFGLAKAMAADPTEGSPFNSPALSIAATQAGMILGTAAYMSPEQARGHATDKRADLWAFGAVLYEMLTGELAFSGGTASDILGAVLRLEPNWERLPPNLPDSLRRVLTRCLQKDQAKRQRDAGDVLLELQTAMTEDPARPERLERSRFRSITWIPMAVALLLALTVVVLLTGDPPGSDPQAVRRFALDLPWQSMPNWGDFGVRISPQGTHLAYPGSDGNRTTLMLRALDSLDPVTLVSPSADPWNLEFSRDGERLAFFRNSTQLNIVSIHGGQPNRLVDLSIDDVAGGITWTDDDHILVGVAGGLIRVATDGQSEFIRATDPDIQYLDPFALPDGIHVLVSIAQPGQAQQLAVLDLTTAALNPLSVPGSEPVYSPTGHLLFRQDTSLIAAAFDLETLRITGQAREVASRVAHGPRLSADGTLVYVAERADGTANLVWVTRDGKADPLADRRDFTHIDLSPDGARALVNISDRAIHAYDIARGTFTVVTNGDEADRAVFPLWAPGNGEATYQQGRAVRLQSVDGSSPPDALLEGSFAVPTSWSPTGDALAVFDRNSDIWILPRGAEPQRFLGSQSNERSGRFAPNGQAFAYVSDELGGEFQVYVTSYPNRERKIAVSINGGLSPIWSADGSELYFRLGSKVMASRISYEPELAATVPEELFDGPYTLDLSGHQRYDVAPDGRFLMVDNSEDFRVVVVEGFFLELERLLPTR